MGKMKNSTREKKIRTWIWYFILCLTMSMFYSGDAYADLKKMCDLDSGSFKNPSGYDNSTFYPDWMSMLPDDMQISRINMPVSHDAGCKYVTIDVPWGPLIRSQYTTQSGTIPEQLARGARVLDVRLGWFSRFSDPKDAYELVLHHTPGIAKVLRSHAGICCEDSGYNNTLRLGKVMEYVQNFLQAHPTETVVMYVTDHMLGKTEVKDALKPLAQQYHYTKPESELKKNKYNRFVWYYGQNTWGSTDAEPVPKLGDVRGKCVMIYVDSSLTAYENSDGHGRSDGPYNKGQAVLTALNSASAQNFAAETHDVFKDEGIKNPNPREPMVKTIGFDYNNAPSSPEPGESASYLNKHFGQHLTFDNFWKSGKRYGWIKLDYINSKESTELVEHIIRSNQGTTMLTAGFYTDGTVPLPEKENIKIYYTTKVNPQRVYVTPKADDFIIRKKEEDSNYIEFSVRSLLLLDALGNKREYGMELYYPYSDYAEFTAISRPDEKEDILYPYTQFKKKADTGFKYDTAVAREVKYVYDVKSKKDIETVDLLFELELKGCSDEKAEGILQDGSSLVETLGPLTVRQYAAEDPSKTYTDEIYILDLDHSETEYDSYIDKQLEEMTLPNSRLVWIRRLPKYTADGVLSAYDVVRFDPFYPKEVELLKQEAGENEGRQLLSVMIYDPDQMQNVEGEVSWIDHEDKFGLRETAIQQLCDLGIELGARDTESVKIHEVFENGKNTGFSGYIHQYDDNHRYIEHDNCYFKLPETLLDGQYRLENDDEAENRFIYRLQTKTDLQVVLDDKLKSILFPEDGRLDEPLSVQVSYRSQTVQVNASEVNGNIVSTTPGEEQWTEYGETAYQLSGLDLSALEDFLDSMLSASDLEYDMDATSEYECSEQREVLMHVTVICHAKNPDLAYLSGNIIWHDGDLLIDHSNHYPDIQFEVNQHCVYGFDYEDIIIKDEDLKKTWTRNNYFITSDKMVYEIDPYILFTEYSVHSISDIAGYQKEVTGNEYTYTRLIDVSGKIRLTGDLPVNNLKVILNEGWSRLSAEPTIFRETDEPGIYEYQFRVPISDSMDSVYDYHSIVELDEAYPVSYTNLVRNTETGAIYQDMIIYNQNLDDKILMPVKIQPVGATAKQAAYQVVASGVINDQPYYAKMTLSNATGFKDAFVLPDFSGEAWFDIYQIPQDRDDIIFDTHVSKVRVVSNADTSGHTVEVYDGNLPTGTDTSVFTNYPGGLEISLKHVTQSLVSDGMDYSTATFDYRLMTDDENGKRILVETAGIQDMGNGKSPGTGCGV